MNMVKSRVESRRQLPRIVAEWTNQPRRGRHTMKVETFRIRIGTRRRIVLPREVCELLSLAVGDTMIVQLENDKTTKQSSTVAVLLSA